MGFPEGKKDWLLIMSFLIGLIRMLGELFLGSNPDGDESHS